MKRIILLTSLVLLIMNLLFGAILSSYGIYNMMISSFVIVFTGILLYFTDSIRLKDGFKVSLMLLFAIGGLIEFVLSLFAPNRITDNWWLVAVVAIMAAEAILLILTNTVSKKID